MVTLYDGGAYLLNGTELIPDNAEAVAALESKARQIPNTFFQMPLAFFSFIFVFLSINFFLLIIYIPFFSCRVILQFFSFSNHTKTTTRLPPRSEPCLQDSCIPFRLITEIRHKYS